MKKLKGIYKIYRHIHSNDHDFDQLIGRIMFDNGVCSILEDHGNLSSNIHEGPITDDHHKFLEKLNHNGYFKVVSEDDISKGLHQELIPDLDLGDVTPDHEYLLLNPDKDGPPSRVEIYEGHWVLNGRNLKPEEKDELLSSIREGRLQLFSI